MAIMRVELRGALYQVRIPEELVSESEKKKKKKKKKRQAFKRDVITATIRYSSFLFFLPLQLTHRRAVASSKRALLLLEATQYGVFA
jgi:hypothetical protein